MKVYHENRPILDNNNLNNDGTFSGKAITESYIISIFFAKYSKK